MRKARMFAAVATVAALAFTTFGVATANAETINSGLIDGNKAASVTIYKYDGTDDTARNDGLSKTIDGKHNKVKGVTFNLFAVQKDGQDIDLSTTNGWTAIKDMALTKDNAGLLARNKLSGYTLGADPAYTKMTDDTGSVSWSNVDKKLYLVTETVTGTPEIYKDNKWQKVTINKKTAPFFLTVPLSTTDTTTGKNGWLYDIKIYPKNEVTTDTIFKEMEVPTTTELGDGVDVTWKINLPLGQPFDGKEFTSIVLTDELADGLTYTSVNSFKISGGNDDGSPNSTDSDLAESTDGGATGDYTVTTEGQKVTIALTKNGLVAANKHIGGKLTGKLVTKQTKAQTIHNDISGTIDNKTTITTKGNGKDDPGNGGDSNWATVKIKKYQTGHENVTLKGAEFKFVALTDGTAELKSYKEADLAGKIGDVIGKAKYTTGDDGTVTAKLFVGKNADNKSRRVCLVELKAPDGYDLPTENATCFELKAATSDTEVVERKIANTQSSKLTEVLGQLPATGAAGLVLMTLAGALLIGAGFFAVAANRRREQE